MSARRAPALLAAAALAAGAAGCGDDEGGGTATTFASAGERVFAENQCGSCHALAAAGSDSAVGPDLDDTTLGAAAAAKVIRRGGTGMPAYEGQLSDAEIAAVADYVAAPPRG